MKSAVPISQMSVAKGCRQFVIVDRPAALAGGPAGNIVRRTESRFQLPSGSSGTRKTGFRTSGPNVFTSLRQKSRLWLDDDRSLSEAARQKRLNAGSMGRGRGASD